MNLHTFLEEKKRLVDIYLDNVLPPESIYPEKLHQAMRYSVFAGGKRLRPILVLTSFQAVSTKQSTTLLPVACSLELIHTYSLIHDDLPAMDNDDYRRGRLTNHKVFGEAMAILAGDALLTLAFKLITSTSLAHRSTSRTNLSDRLLKIAYEISWAAGMEGMIGGQAADILSEGKEIESSTLEYIHKHKTAALIRASMRAGAILGGATKTQLSDLTSYGEDIGLAFQIVDDILDIEGSQEELGKDIKSDLSKGKKTFPDLFGLSESKRKAKVLVGQAIERLDGFGRKADPLRAIAHYIIERRK
jgi:geranylgeranyl diphosphate synthase, type II